MKIMSPNSLEHACDYGAKVSQQLSWPQRDCIAQFIDLFPVKE